MCPVQIARRGKLEEYSREWSDCLLRDFRVFDAKHHQLRFQEVDGGASQRYCKVQSAKKLRRSQLRRVWLDRMFYLPQGSAASARQSG